jgi:hypothetical protein
MTGEVRIFNQHDGRGSAFAKLGDSFVATEFATGPWHAGHCHGGAVAGLLTFAVAQVPSRAPMGLARLSIDLFGPVPIEVQITSRIVIDKNGARTQRIRGDLLVDDRIVASGSALRVRTANEAAEPPHASPPDETKLKRGAPGGFANAFDVIAERGGIALEGPGRVWFRLASPLFDDEPVDRVAQAVATADFSSAIGMNRAFSRFAFPSIDLTVGFARAPVSDWILVDASNHDCDKGRAICHATLSDALGAFAQVIQTSFVEPRLTAMGESE